MTDTMTVVLAVGLGVFGGALLGLLLGRRERMRLAAELADARADAAGLQARLKARKLAQRESADSFAALASDALRVNSKEFRDQFGALARSVLDGAQERNAGELARHRQVLQSLLDPLSERLEELRASSQLLEVKRESAYTEILQHIDHLGKATTQLDQHSRQLASVLGGSSRARGRWGEVTLRRVVELAGMTEHCDFVEQRTDAAGKRPDLIVLLPGEGAIPVDAKTPFADYQRACEESDPVRRKRHVAAHAQVLRETVRELARRDYPASLGSAIDFTVMFVPAEPMLSMAFEADPDLHSQALGERVLIATPATLIALLRTVGLSWRQERLKESAQQIVAAARRLHERTTLFGEHLAKVGRGLGAAVAGYNEAVGSYQGRVLPAGRQLEELGTSQAADRSMEAIPEVDVAPRELDSGA